MSTCRVSPTAVEGGGIIYRNETTRAVQWLAAAVLGTILFLPTLPQARDWREPEPPPPRATSWISPAAPIIDDRIHYAGEAWMTISNRGNFQTSHGGGGRCPVDQQLLRINWCPSFEYPGGSRIDYLFDGGFWFGGIVGNDTLLTAAYTQSGGNFETTSFAPIAEGPPPGYDAGCAVFGEGKGLEQIYTCVYSDTFLTPQLTGTHTPMGIEVTQVSHQSSDNFARGFIIFDLSVKNVSERTIRNLYCGVFCDCDAHYVFAGGAAYLDDISGFLKTWPNAVDPRFDDTLNVSWAADNDGDPLGGRFPRTSARGAMGIRFLRMPEGANVSFNWWAAPSVGVIDWGPRSIDDVRDFGTGGQGVPQGDRNGYHIMSNNEIDYGQLLAGQDLSDEGWKPPSSALNCNLADGADTRGVISAGPEIALEPGESVAFTVAIIGADGIHRFPDNADKYDCDDPYPFIADLDFSDLARSAWWAGFVFDNFGVDSDKDGYSGEYYEPVDGFDTVYYKGDGCPDFSGPAPPKGPGESELRLVTRPEALEITWLGAATELDVDPLLRRNDFEGYKVYMAERNSPDDIPASGDYSLLASWDVDDYRRYTYEPRNGNWEVSSNPLSVEQWREFFKDIDCSNSGEAFDPRDYPTPSPATAYCYTELDRFGQTVERRAYFAPQDFNQGDTIVINGERVPNLIQRIQDVDTIIGSDTLQYGVYRVVLDDLLPSKHYFISVTAFDYGDPANDLDPLETTPGTRKVSGIPIYSADVVEELWNAGGAQQDSVRVIVYPNPYRARFTGPDGEMTSYREQGFEGRFGQDIRSITDEDRRIHFINVPDTATIRIYSLDGDLVRELNHPDNNLTAYSSKISWDLVSRNTQAVESGIYIYRVDSRLGSQVGKLVIIK